MEHERLTQRNNIGGAYYLHCFQESTCYGLGASVKCNSCEFNNEVLEKLATYKDLEEQGLLLRLPCKLGDKVWAITSTANYSLGEYREVSLKHPQEKKIQSISVTKNGLLYHVKDRAYSEQAFGKTVFLTKEEAEQALKQIGE